MDGSFSSESGTSQGVQRGACLMLPVCHSSPDPHLSAKPPSSLEISSSLKWSAGRLKSHRKWKLQEKKCLELVKKVLFCIFISIMYNLLVCCFIHLVIYLSDNMTCLQCICCLTLFYCGNPDCSQ